MSVQNALQFIQQVRQQERLNQRIQQLQEEANVQSIVEFAAETGFVFTPAELRAAHKHDWAMRWVRYGAAPAGPEDADSAN